MESDLELSGINVSWLCELWESRCDSNDFFSMSDMLHGYRMLTDGLSARAVDDIYTLQDVLDAMRGM